MIREQAKPPGTLVRVYRAILRRLPIMSGLTALAFNRLANWLFRDCPSPIVATMLDGTEMLVDANDYNGRILYLFGTNDPKVHHVVQGLTKPGDVFLDIGSNYSSIGILAADKVGDSGEVHLFEPQRYLCDRIRDALISARKNNVHLHPVGLLGVEGGIEMYVNERNSGMATFVPRKVTQTWQTRTFEVKNIASYVPDLISNRPFSAKLDVEGAEPEIMPWLLQQPNLRFLVFEASHHYEELWRLVAKSELILYGLQKSLFAKRIRRIDKFEAVRQFHDMVAIRFPATSNPPAVASPYSIGDLL